MINNSFYKASNILEMDHHAQMFQDWELSYDQISTGKFKSSLDSLTFNNIEIYRECFSTSIFQQGTAKRDCLNIGLYIENQTPILWQGKKLAQNEIITVMGNEELMLITPENSICLGLSIPTIFFNNDTKDLLQSTCTLQKEDNAQSVIYLKLYKLINTLLDHPLFVATERTRTQIQADIIDLIIENIDNTPIKVKVSRKKANTVVHTVIDYTQNNSAQLFSISDLCYITNTSRRTLQSCFEQTIGLSPALFLKYLRLNAVRKTLAQTTEVSSISNIATDFGFWHLSQFAYDYKRLFSESPSDTLKLNKKIKSFS